MQEAQKLHIYVHIKIVFLQFISADIHYWLPFVALAERSTTCRRHLYINFLRGSRPYVSFLFYACIIITNYRRHPYNDVSFDRTNEIMNTFNADCLRTCIINSFVCHMTSIKFFTTDRFINYRLNVNLHIYHRPGRLSQSYLYIFQSEILFIALKNKTTR